VVVSSSATVVPCPAWPRSCFTIMNLPGDLSCSRAWLWSLRLPCSPCSGTMGWWTCPAGSYCAWAGGCSWPSRALLVLSSEPKRCCKRFRQEKELFMWGGGGLILSVLGEGEKTTSTHVLLELRLSVSWLLALLGAQGARLLPLSDCSCCCMTSETQLPSDGI